MEDQRNVASQETMDILHDLSQLLNTGLSREQLRACVELIESGVNAEAVAVSAPVPVEDAKAIVENLRKEAAKR
uniref:Mitotic-spindle organizing protein 1 n=1 Tax=Kalmanozyma brasiliensis (strain GHG001) TaxID=1365824 RepID=V5EVL8_KALBG